MLLKEKQMVGAMSGADLKKYRSKKIILGLLYETNALSAAAVGKRLGVSLPTVQVLLNELSKEKLIENKGEGESNGGRKPVLYGLKQNSLFVIACEVGRYSGKLALYNSQNENVSEILRFETSIDDEDLIDKIEEHVQIVLNESKITMDRVHAIGVAMPGLVNVDKGINNTIKNADFRNVKRHLERRFKKLSYVNNDARMQAFGEYRFGAARGYENAVVINWNWGIGLGMIFNGELYSGATGFAGELSHIKVVDDGDLCICGKRGCLETVSSVKVLLNKAREGIKKGIISQLTNDFAKRLPHLMVHDLINAARKGDEFSITLLNEVGLALGTGMSMTIQLLNPDIIVLGGVMSRANQFVLTPIQQSLNKYCLEEISINTKIKISENWEQAGLLGITAMLFQKLFSIASN